MTTTENRPKRIEIDEQRLLADARELAFPRYPGTEGDRRAIAIVARRLRDAGLEVQEEPFSYDIRTAVLALRAVLIVGAIAVGAAGGLAQASMPAAAALFLLGLLVSGGMLLWSPGTERLYARPGPTSTSNVVGYRRVERPRSSLILMAHHDSKSQNLTFPVRMGLTLLALAGGLVLAGTLLLGLVRGVPPGGPWLAPGLGGLTALSLLVLSTLRSGNESPGAVDNAGSVAIVCELARVLLPDLAEDVELIVLSPGAEEDHMVGALRWLGAHREELAGRAVWALNFDGAGAPGRTVLIERYGLGKPFSPTLSRIARDCARRLGLSFRSITMLPAIGIDAIPFANHGLECLTLTSGSLDRATISVHSRNDVAEHLDAAALGRIARLAREVALRAQALGV